MYHSRMRYVAIFLPADRGSLSITVAARPNCRSDIQGVTYCVEDGGDTHLLIIDLSDPYLRVQTVMAHDVLDVWPPEEERESVSDMAQALSQRRA